MTRSHKKTKSNDDGTGKGKYTCFFCSKKAPSKQSVITMYDELIAFNCGLCHMKYSVTIMKEGPIKVYKPSRQEIENMINYTSIIKSLPTPLENTIYNDI
jgi:transcription elongation factor Elf1